jgi:fatty-acyl-CoA synthase/long-chain acyl-CoA synthetase
MHATIRPDKLAFVCGEQRRTYGELNVRLNRIGNALKGLGVTRGDRVAIMAHNSLEGVETAAANSKIGAISVLLNYRLRGPEITYVLNDSGAKVIVAGPGLVSVVESARSQVPGEVVYVAIGDEVPEGWRRYDELVESASGELPPGEGGLGSTMSYTSGTTGKPRGAYRPTGVPVPEILRICQVFELTEQDIHLLAGPYYHSAPSFFVTVHLLLGATIVIQPKFDPVEALQLIERHHVTTTFMAPTLLQRLCEVPEEVAARYNTHSLRAIILAGAPCPYALKVRAVPRFGSCLWEFYGATETGIVTVLRPADQLRKPGSCGTAGPGQEILLLDASGQPVPDGVPGELWTRNSWLAQYYNQPEVTASRMQDGFFTVGDIAYRDAEGYYYICDRRIDMIISGGVNIYPAEIEAVLFEHPAVADAAVIGVPDEHWGESVKAVVALKPGAHATAEELIAFCAFVVELDDSLPKGLSHFDFDIDNILTKNDRVTAILDFGDMECLPLVVCLGYTLWDVLLENREQWHAQITHFSKQAMQRGLIDHLSIPPCNRPLLPLSPGGLLCRLVSLHKPEE